MKDDPVTHRIRESRKRISAKFGHDVSKMVQYYIKIQCKRKKYPLPTQRFRRTVSIWS